ncbi:hypothetical protein E4U53_002239 [Claviceps sorghi]|nr:hypothetical protein E4U53_002239 [Claviceps sorghi]
MALSRSLLAAVAMSLLPLSHAWNIELPPCTEPFKPFVYSGCFQEGQSSNTLTFRSSLDNANMTVETCMADCKGNGFRYAGLEYYGVCYCGATVDGPQVDESQCSFPCSGNKAQKCGGDRTLSVWQDPTFPNAEKLTVDSYKSLGCYTDESSKGRTLSYPMDLGSEICTPKTCLAACEKRGFPFAGIENGNECYCGVVLANDTAKVDSSQCGVACLDGSSTKCGGSARLSLWIAKDLWSLEPCVKAPDLGTTTLPVMTTTTTKPSTAVTTSSIDTTTTKPAETTTITPIQSTNQDTTSSYKEETSTSSQPVTTTTPAGTTSITPIESTSQDTTSYCDDETSTSSQPIATTTPASTTVTPIESTSQDTTSYCDDETSTSSQPVATTKPASTTITPVESASQDTTSYCDDETSTSSQPIATTKPASTTATPIESTSQDTTSYCDDETSTSSQPVATTKPASTTLTPVESTSQDTTSYCDDETSTSSQPITTTKPASITITPVESTSQDTKPASTTATPIESTSQDTTSYWDDETSTSSQPITTTKPADTTTQQASTTTPSARTTSKPADTTTPKPTTTTRQIPNTTTNLCTATVTVPAKCEWQCGTWCAPALPSWQDSNGCQIAKKTCHKQISSCFKEAGWPGSVECFKFQAWCHYLDGYCNESCPGKSCGKSDCWNKYHGGDGSSPARPPTTTTSVYACSTTSKAAPATTKPAVPCPPQHTNVCTQPTNDKYGYGPGKPVGGIAMPVVGCNDRKDDFGSRPYKLYTEADSRKCPAFRWSQWPSVCSSACKEQYDHCIATYSKGCETFGWRNNLQNKRAEGSGSGDEVSRRDFGLGWGINWRGSGGRGHGGSNSGSCAVAGFGLIGSWLRLGSDGPQCWGFGGNKPDWARARCEAQYKDCRQVNRWVKEPQTCTEWRGC